MSYLLSSIDISKGIDQTTLIYKQLSSKWVDLPDILEGESTDGWSRVCYRGCWHISFGSLISYFCNLYNVSDPFFFKQITIFYAKEQKKNVPKRLEGFKGREP